MGLDAQCCIFGELIVCAYSTGTYGVYVRKCQLGCVTRSYVSDCGEQADTTYTYSGTGTLVPRGPYEGTEQASVDVRDGQWQFYSC